MPSTDIQAHCCGADKLFDAKSAKKEYKKYLKKGPARVTRKLIAQIEAGEVGETLLDVGGGIGAIQWWFLKNGGHATYDVDASSGYTDMAKEHAAQEGLTDRTHYFVGDMTAHADDLPEVDHVTLDKVICCYPDYKALVSLACAKSNRTVSLSYPMDGFIAQTVRSIGVMAIRLTGNPFKPYIHRVTDVRDLFAKNGFEIRTRQLSFPWHIETYLRR